MWPPVREVPEGFLVFQTAAWAAKAKEEGYDG
jgi:hypothetical protein